MGTTRVECGAHHCKITWCQNIIEQYAGIAQVILSVYVKTCACMHRCGLHKLLGPYARDWYDHRKCDFWFPCGQLTCAEYQSCSMWWTRLERWCCPMMHSATLRFWCWYLCAEDSKKRFAVSKIEWVPESSSPHSAQNPFYSKGFHQLWIQRAISEFCLRAMCVSWTKKMSKRWGNCAL